MIEGERRLLEAAKNIAVQRLADPAGAIEDAIFKDRTPLDDVAILTITFRDCSTDGANGDPSRALVHWIAGTAGTVLRLKIESFFSQLKRAAVATVGRAAAATTKFQMR